MTTTIHGRRHTSSREFDILDGEIRLKKINKKKTHQSTI